MNTIEKLQTLIIEDIEEKLEIVPKYLCQKIHSFNNTARLKTLYARLIDCSNISDITNLINNIDSEFGRNALKYKQNYDAIIKFIAQEFRGKTLEIFGIQSANIVDVFTFEPVEIRIKTGRLDLIFRDESGAYFHIEEQRNMSESDLYRCGIYHFQASRQYGQNITDLLLLSGNPYSGPNSIKTKSGLYQPIFIDLTTKDGFVRLSQIKDEIKNNKYSNIIELIFLPLYGDVKPQMRKELAQSVIRYEIDLLKNDNRYEKLLISTLIMCNKILDKQTLQNFYEEVKNMIDILEVAREDGIQQGMEKGMEKGMLKSLQDMIVEALETKLDIIPARIVQSIKSITTIETLRGLFRQALKCDDLNHFERKLVFATS